MTLITSRRRLVDLANAIHLTVDVFSAEEALQYLANATVDTPVGVDRLAPARIAQRCGFLPLALGLVAGHIANHPEWTLTDQANRLDERFEALRLDTGVEVALDLSYRHLTVDQRRLLRLLAVHPGQDVDPYAAAALADTDLPSVLADLHQLWRDHLLQQPSPGRYALHDLVRTYANARAVDEDPQSARHAALTRLFDYYVATTAAAVDSRYRNVARLRLRIPRLRTPIPDLSDPETALAWLDVERPTLVAVAEHTATNGWPTHTIRLSQLLFRYLIGGHPTEGLAVHGYARDMADRVGDVLGQVHALNGLGTTCIQIGRFTRAAEHLEQALLLCERTTDLRGEARTLTNLAIVEMRLGRYQPVVRHLERAIALDEQIGDAAGMASSLLNLGVVETRLGRYDTATGHLEQARTSGRDRGDKTLEATALTMLGDVAGREGRFGPAMDCLEQALALLREVGYRDEEAWTTDTIGRVDTLRGRPAEAIDHHRRALAIFRDIGEPYGESWACNGLGEAASAAGLPAQALVHHEAARAVAVEIGDRDQEARSHAGLGHAHHALGDDATARQHYHRALRLYTGLGTPEAALVSARLDSLDRPARCDQAGITHR